MEEYQISLQAHNNLFIVLNSSGKKFAMKRLKRGERFEDLQDVKNDKEVRFLKKLHHETIVQISDVIYNSTDRTGFIILPFMQMNLLELLESQAVLTEIQRRHIVKQIFESLTYIHSQNLYHRDLHPGNIMVEQQQYSSDKTLYEIKLIDFGSSKSKMDANYTDYVGVRWYRAPEILFSCSTYNEKVDIFATGCIIYEIYHKKPLFPGYTEISQLKELCVILGTPTQEEWPQGTEAALKKGMEIGHYKKSNLKTIFCDMPEDMIDLCAQCLVWNPEKRISASQALKHQSLINAI